MNVDLIIFNIKQPIKGYKHHFLFLIGLWGVQIYDPVLFPVRIDDAVMDTDQAWASSVRRKWNIGDFTNWKDHDSYKKAFDRLLRDLKAAD